MAVKRRPVAWAALSLTSHEGELPGTMPGAGEGFWCTPAEQVMLAGQGRMACRVGGCGGMGMGVVWLWCLCMVAPVGLRRVPRRQ